MCEGVVLLKRRSFYLNLLHLAPKAGLANLSLESRDCVRLVAAIGSVLSAMPLKELLGPLESLIGSRVRSLQELAAQEAREARKPLVERELAVLSALCHHIYPTLQSGEQHPVSYSYLHY